MQTAWQVRDAGATPQRVQVEPAVGSRDGGLHIVGIGSATFVHGHWGRRLYHTWAQARAASVEQQEAQVRQAESELAWHRERLETLRSLTEPGSGTGSELPSA